MLLTNFKEVIALDEQISKLHQELSVLYAERSSIANSTDQSKTFIQSTKSDTTVHATTTREREQYEILRAAWMKYAVTVPAFKSLQAKLTSANAILSNLESNGTDINDYEFFLSPPTAKIAFPLKNNGTEKHQGFDSPDMPALSAQKQWKLLMVYKKRDGLPVSNYKNFIDKKQYMISGYNMRGLNIRDYGLYTLMQNTPVDVDQWSLLPASNTIDKNQVVCAGFIDNQYRYVLDDTTSLLGDNSFRPAMEIK